MRSSRNVFRWITPAVCRVSASQDGLRYVSFLFRRGSGSPEARSRIVVRLTDLVCSFRDCACSGGDPDGERGDAGNGRTESAARQSAFLREHIGFVVLSAGSPLGAECGSGTAASLDSLHLIRGVGAFYAAGTVREHSAVSWRCRQLPRRRLSASSPRAGTAPRPDNTPQPFRRRCTPHAQPARRRGSATAQRPRRTARLP